MSVFSRKQVVWKGSFRSSGLTHFVGYTVLVGIPLADVTSRYSRVTKLPVASQKCVVFATFGRTQEHFVTIPSTLTIFPRKVIAAPRGYAMKSNLRHFKEIMSTCISAMLNQEFCSLTLQSALYELLLRTGTWDLSRR